MQNNAEKKKNTKEEGTRMAAITKPQEAMMITQGATKAFDTSCAVM